jgi:integrase
MGEVIRKTKAGRFVGWYVRWVDSDGKRKAKATKATSAAEARRILVELEAQAGRRQLGVPERPAAIKGTALIARWLDEAQPRTSNRVVWEKKQRYAVSRALPYLDRIVDPQDAARTVRKLGAEMAPGTLRLTMSKLKTAWNWAVAEGISTDNPWSKLRLPKAEQRIEYLSRSEVAALIAAADEYRDVVGVAVRLAVFAGLRVSEVYGLRWRSVDLDRGVLTIRSGYRDAPTKSRRDRVIPIADQLRDALAEWRPRCPSVDTVCPSLSGIAENKRPDIRRLYQSSGLAVPASPWHVLRHTFASHFLMSGGSLLTLQRLLGHSSIAITQIYSHLSDEHVAGEIKKLRF